MTDANRQFPLERWPALGWVFAALFLTTSAFAANASIVEKLSGYVHGCETALLSGDLAAFDGMAVETETITESVEIFGWRDGEVVVSLLVRIGAKRSGVCDIAYQPASLSDDAVIALQMLQKNLQAPLLQGKHKFETVASGQILLSCSGERGMALFIDPAATASGFAAQVATVPAHRMGCDG